MMRSEHGRSNAQDRQDGTGAGADPRCEGRVEAPVPEGWRAGKPEEDPEKMKRWGLITARPSEFLIHMRGGSVRE